MRLVFAGTPVVALPALDALVAAGADLVGVVTRPDAARGRSNRAVPSPVAQRGLELGVPVLKPSHPRDADFQARLRQLAPDCVPVVAYGALIPDAALRIPRHGWVNLHFSLLPAWRGAAPVQRALMAGVRRTGVTTFRIVAALDAGPVYHQSAVEIGPDETAGELLARLADRGAGLLTETISAIEAGAEPTPQDEAGVSLAPKVTVADAELHWALSAAILHNLIRGCSPNPGAWTTYAGNRFKILGSRRSVPADLAPGQVQVDKTQVRVGTGAGTLALTQVQPIGRRPMTALDWARGLRDPEPWLGRE